MAESAAHWLAHAERLPTLTEVVEPAGVRALPLPESHAVDTALLVRDVLAEIAPYVDDRLEAQLRAALAPAVARAVGGLLTEGRAVLSASLRDLVEAAVARALARVLARTLSEPPQNHDPR